MEHGGREKNKKEEQEKGRMIAKNFGIRFERVAHNVKGKFVGNHFGFVLGRVWTKKWTEQRRACSTPSDLYAAFTCCICAS